MKPLSIPQPFIKPTGVKGVALDDVWGRRTGGSLIEEVPADAADAIETYLRESQERLTTQEGFSVPLVAKAFKARDGFIHIIVFDCRYSQFEANQFIPKDAHVYKRLFSGPEQGSKSHTPEVALPEPM